VSVAEVARAALHRHHGSLLVAEHSYDPPTEQPNAQGYGNNSAAYAFGFHGAEVEVDDETGAIRMLRWPRHTTSAGQSTGRMSRGRLPRPHGFQVAVFPIKIARASGAWVRAVALVSD
jgi:hypothetical protein